MASLTPPGDQAPRPGLDHTLLKRLWQRAEQPGCVRHGQVRAILARHQRMAGDPPLAGLLLRRGRGSADTLQARPVIVDARPAGAAPPPSATPPRATGPSAAPRPAVPARLTPPDDLPTPPRPETRAMTRPRDAVWGNGAGALAQHSPAPTAQRSPVATAGPVTAATGRPSSQLQPAADSAPAVTTVKTATGPVREQAGPRPAAGPHQPGWHALPVAPRPPSALSPAAPTVTPPGVAAAPAASAFPGAPIATGRPVSRDPAMTRGAGPVPPASEDGRLVVRAANDSSGPRSATLAWPRLAPEQAVGSAQRSVPVVRERVSPSGAWRPGLPIARRPAQLPAGPAAPARAAADLAGLAGPAGGMRDPARSAASRTPPEQPPGRQADPVRREREPARPPIDMDRIISTVQRRLMHQMVIERERRGMTR
jgi:hypothetical protein